MHLGQHGQHKLPVKYVACHIKLSVEQLTLPLTFMINGTLICVVCECLVEMRYVAPHHITPHNITITQQMRLSHKTQ